MHEIPIIIDITVALLVALLGGLLARQVKLPPIVGYLLAGIVIGPFTPGFVGDIHIIQQLAELGVIFLLFGVGLHFSLKDLWAVRDVAIGGAILQMALATGLTVAIGLLLGWTLTASIVMGLAISIASTVVLLRNLTDNNLLNTSHGQVAVGWLVLEDIATVLILVLLPALFVTTEQPLWQTAGLALLKTAIFAVIILVVGMRIIPWILLRIARIRSRELFIVAVVVITLGIAVSASIFFGVSLALGAFLAGVVVHESALSHQVEVEIQPFRETFSVLFFVSVGMLVNPGLLVTHIGQILIITAVIILGKGLIVLLLGFFFKRPARTILIVAIALSQIGEFSFLLGQAGMNLDLITQDQYSLLLTGALLSITVNPFIFHLRPWIEDNLRKLHSFWSLLDRHAPVQQPITKELKDHVIVIGYGRVGKHIVEVLSRLDTQLLVIDLDAERMVELQKRDIPTLFGDAANSDILNHAHLTQARAVVISIPNETSILSVTASIRDVAPDIIILARAASEENVRMLVKMKADTVIYPEMEGGLQLLDQTLLRLGYPETDVIHYTDAVRRDQYNLAIQTKEEHETLTKLRSCTIDKRSPASSLSNNDLDS